MFSMAEIRAHVDQMNDEFAAAKQRVEAWRTSEFVERIEPDIGIVRVFGSGELKSVELRSYRVTHYSGVAVGRAVLEAINRAEWRVFASDRNSGE
jgi:hypothetical protein